MRVSLGKLLLTNTFEFLVTCIMPITCKGIKTNLSVKVVGVSLLGTLLDGKVGSCMTWMSTWYHDILCLLK